MQKRKQIPADELEIAKDFLEHTIPYLEEMLHQKGTENVYNMLKEAKKAIGILSNYTEPGTIDAVLSMLYSYEPKEREGKTDVELEISKNGSNYCVSAPCLIDPSESLVGKGDEISEAMDDFIEKWEDNFGKEVEIYPRFILPNEDLPYKTKLRGI